MLFVMNKPVLELASIRKSFSKGSSNKIEVLKGVDLQLFPGEIVALVAPSGAGKSTLVNLITGLNKPSNGSVIVDKENINTNLYSINVMSNMFGRYRCTSITLCM